MTRHRSKYILWLSLLKRVYLIFKYNISSIIIGTNQLTKFQHYTILSERHEMLFIRWMNLRQMRCEKIKNHLKSRPAYLNHSHKLIEMTWFQKSHIVFAFFAIFQYKNFMRWFYYPSSCLINSNTYLSIHRIDNTFCISRILLKTS